MNNNNNKIVSICCALGVIILAITNIFELLNGFNHGNIVVNIGPLLNLIAVCIFSSNVVYPHPISFLILCITPLVNIWLSQSSPLYLIIDILCPVLVIFLWALLAIYVSLEQKLYFSKKSNVPKALSIVFNIIFCLLVVFHLFAPGGNIIYFALNILPILFIKLWVIDTSKNEKYVNSEEPEEINSEYEEDFGDYSIGLVRHILFYIFFGFVWRFIWIYKMTYFTNRATSEPYRNPTTKLLLCLFVPLYYFYWLYQTSLRVDQIAKEHEINSNLTVICPLTSFVADIISVVIMQERVNRMVEMHKISE